MMNILETIVAKKKTEVAERKAVQTISDLEKLPLFAMPTLSLKEYLLQPDKSGIIAEFKKQSPSKGIINNCSFTAEVVKDYEKHGASAVSVLTDGEFFGGSLDDLKEAASVLHIPLLRKDFIIDEYQLIEAKAFGADIILLIAACLSEAEVKSLSATAQNLGLNVLLEIHSESEFDHISDEIDVVGINNRDLKTFKVDLNHSVELAKKIPSQKLKISESGIDDVKTIEFLRNNGFSGFLIGERFMKEENPGEAFGVFVDALKQLSK